MPAQLNPYLGFRDNAREAMTFYQTVFGGDLSMATFADFHASEDPAEADKLMHSQLTGDTGIVFMGADTPNSMEYDDGQRISMSLSGDDEGLLRGWFDKLSEGATDVLPMNKAPWGDTFGMVTDKFGVRWMVNASR